MRVRVAGLALAVALAGIGNVAAAETKVGLLLPKTGVFAALGKEIDDGFVFALEEAGQAKNFTLFREDDESKPPVGVAKARKLTLENNVDVLVGIVSSGVLGAVRDFVHEAKVPLIVANAGNDEVTGANCTPYIVRVSFSNAQINRPMGSWMVQQGFKKAYTLAPDYAAGHQTIEAFAAAFKAAGGEIVGSAYTPFGQTKDFSPYLTNAAAANPDAIYVFYAGSEAIGFVKQYQSFGLAPKIPLVGSGFLNSPLYVAAEGDAAIGIKAGLHYVPTLDTPENKAFVAAFKAKFNRVPSEFAVQGYDSARVLLEAIKGGGKDRASLTAALAKVKYTGPRGPLEIDPATNNIVQNIYVYDTIKEGEALTQKVIGVIPNVRDEPNGCKLN